jgi:hypothetical protein
LIGRWIINFVAARATNRAAGAVDQAR